ncbi:MAG: DoxX family protein [Alistipes sp.]|nr:DoxX family protein [Alistipes sp.]
MIKKLSLWIFSADSFASERRSLTLLALRIFAGLLMIPYGVSKIERYDELAVEFFGDPIGLGMEPSLILTIAAQIGFSIFLILGLQTRIMAILLAFHMAVATKYHFFDPFFTKALPLLFLGIYIFIVALGAGKYSVDALCLNGHIKTATWRSREWCYLLIVGLSFVAMWFTFANTFSGVVSYIVLALCAAAMTWAYIDSKNK